MPPCASSAQRCGPRGSKLRSRYPALEVSVRAVRLYSSPVQFELFLAKPSAPKEFAEANFFPSPKYYVIAIRSLSLHQNQTRHPNIVNSPNISLLTQCPLERDFSGTK